VLPLEFNNGETRATFAIDGTETFDVIGKPLARASLKVIVHKVSGETLEIETTCRLDTAEELSIYEAGGVLQRFAQDFLDSKSATAN
jgi:aconitate hydratase